MNITNTTKKLGQYRVQIKDKDGNLKDLWQENSFGFWLYELTPYLTGHYTKNYVSPNTVVNAGLAELAKLSIDTGTPTAFSYIAVGTDNTAVMATDTSLGAEITDSGLSRAQGTKSTVTKNVTDDTSQLVNSFNVTGTKAITELGVFNAASTGTMLSRAVITTKNVENGDTIQFTFQLINS
jgi:hypothetical protein